MKKLLKIKIIIFVVLCNTSFADTNDIKEYWPYPIVFVHGIQPGSPKSWATTKTEIGNRYFRGRIGMSWFIEYLP